MCNFTSSSCLFLILAVTLVSSSFFSRYSSITVAAKQNEGKSSKTTHSTQSPYNANTSRRERNLDHWDAETLAFYLGMDMNGNPLPSNLPLSDSNEDESSDLNSPANNVNNEPSSSSSLLVDEYVGHDAAIMFYAQRDPNSHALAPIWDAIATHIHAGTKQSNIIMALFDCERDATHLQLCMAAGIQFYPTILFVGAGTYHDVDPITGLVLGRDKSAGPAGATTLRRTVKFQGDWQFGDEILDWIRAMQGLSAWHKLTESGFLRFIRNGFFGFFRSNKGRGVMRRKDMMSLPVGIPLGGGGNAGGAGVSLSHVRALEDKLQKAEESTKDMEKLAVHASYLIDSILFPPEPLSSSGANDTTTKTKLIGHEKEEDGSGYVDIFTYMAEHGGWDAKLTSSSSSKDGTNNASSSTASTSDLELQVLRSCLIELSLDYCTRMSTHLTTEYLNELTSVPEAQYPSFFEMEEQLKELIVTKEPYCSIFDACLVVNFKKVECRPDQCPFNDAVACRYVSACFQDAIANEYAVALGLIEEGETVKNVVASTKKTAVASKDGGGEKNKSDSTADGNSEGKKKKKKTSFAWGMS